MGARVLCVSGVCVCVCVCVGSPFVKNSAKCLWACGRHHAIHPAAASHCPLTRMVGGLHVSRCVIKCTGVLGIFASSAHVAHPAQVDYMADLANVEPAAHLANLHALPQRGPTLPNMASEMPEMAAKEPKI
eukprot:3111197-Pyramimonas_sp.AAC.1